MLEGVPATFAVDVVTVLPVMFTGGELAVKVFDVRLSVAFRYLEEPNLKAVKLLVVVFGNAWFVVGDRWKLLVAWTVKIN